MIRPINYYKFRSTEREDNLDVYATALTSAVQAYDKNRDSTDKVWNALSTIQSNKYGLEYMKTVSDKLNGIFDKVATDTQGNKRWDTADEQVRDAVNTFYNDKVVKGIQMSQANRLEGEKDRQKITLTGTAVNVGEDYEDHKPINPDGTVSIFQPLWQQKADYDKAAQEIAKDLKADVDTVYGQSPIPGLFSVNEREKITREKVNANFDTYRDRYASTDEAQQQYNIAYKQAKKQGLPEAERVKYANAEVDNIIKGVLVSKIYESTKLRQLVEDPQSKLDNKIEEAKAKSEMRIEENKQKQKNKTSGAKNKNALELFGTATSGFSTPDNITVIKAAVINKAINEGYIIKPSSTEWKNIRYDKALADEDLSSKIITKFEANSIKSVNDGDKAFDGAWYGVLSYEDKDGKNKRTIQAEVINNNTDIVRNYSALSDVKRTMNEMATSKKENAFKVIRGVNMFDTELFDIEVQKIGKGYRLKPLFTTKDKNGKIVSMSPVDGITSENKEKLGITGIKMYYTFDEFQTIFNNRFADTLRDIVPSAKNVIENQ